MRIRLKRAYDPPDGSDGARILVDRLWPRGITKSSAALAELRALAAKHPSVTLVFASRNLERNNAVVLKQFLERAGKPKPASTSRTAPKTRKVAKS